MREGWEGRRGEGPRDEPTEVFKSEDGGRDEGGITKALITRAW